MSPLSVSAHLLKVAIFSFNSSGYLQIICLYYFFLAHQPWILMTDFSLY